jgi:hypothetical protein
MMTAFRMRAAVMTAFRMRTAEMTAFRSSYDCIYSRVVDPDPDWIRIQRLCVSGSVLGIQIQGQENEEISVGKCTF